MQLCKVQWLSGETRVGVVSDGHVRFLDLEDYPGIHTLSDILHDENPASLARELVDDRSQHWPISDLTLLPPIDRQEVWAAGVTYKRSEEARKKESAGAGQFYDLVYRAARPELFFKATPHRVVGDRGRVRIRADSRWSVPEPELALVLNPQLKLVGYTIGNDMSARDIEGENPLYLPQAKVYDACCALGPVITLADSIADPREIQIRLTIDRAGERVFEGSTRISEMARTFADLIAWLGRDNSFPHGVVLLTGTGIVPPDDFTLRPGDIIHIDATGIGRLTNIVEQRSH
ncbi:MAG: fumarylacetoacetate hydrolase family protein [Gemmatales bacterium]|nr:fumarylacetoacetate hydrolase family protein [Gemmatales bacterium]MDW8387252.1 fumarylacetoacetate hydrolase family protein [Gemmatales bacterium]